MENPCKQEPLAQVREETKQKTKMASTTNPTNKSGMITGAPEG
jgi:hypothetical protein